MARVVSSSTHNNNKAISTQVPFTEGELDRPCWTGDTPISRLVPALIAIKPLYNLMKLGARQVLIRSVIMPAYLWMIFLEKLWFPSKYSSIYTTYKNMIA